MWGGARDLYPNKALRAHALCEQTSHTVSFIYDVRISLQRADPQARAGRVGTDPLLSPAFPCFPFLSPQLTIMPSISAG